MVQSEMFPLSNVQPDVRDRLDRALEVLVRLEQLAQQGTPTASVSEVLGASGPSVAMVSEDTGYPAPVVPDQKAILHISVFELPLAKVLDAEFRKHGCCVLGYAELGKRIGCSASNVGRLSQSLQKRQLVRMERRMRQGLGAGNGAAPSVLYPLPPFLAWFRGLRQE